MLRSGLTPIELAFFSSHLDLFNVNSRYYNANLF